MNKNLKWIILYLILNLLLIIIPQSQKNFELKSLLNEQLSLEIIPEINNITDEEFINKLEESLKAQSELEKSYTYSKQSLEYIEIYQVELNLKGGKSDISNFINNLCKLEEFNIAELICDYDKSPSEANLKLISMGGKHE